MDDEDHPENGPGSLGEGGKKSCSSGSRTVPLTPMNLRYHLLHFGLPSRSAGVSFFRSRPSIFAMHLRLFFFFVLLSAGSIAAPGRGPRHPLHDPVTMIGGGGGGPIAVADSGSAIKAIRVMDRCSISTDISSSRVRSTGRAGHEARKTERLTSQSRRNCPLYPRRKLPIIAHFWVTNITTDDKPRKCRY